MRIRQDRRGAGRIWITALLFLGSACSSESDGASASGGAAGQAGSTGKGGAAGGGNTGQGGGMAAGGAAGSAGSSGGSSGIAGSGGSAGAAGAVGHVAKPSAGCGKTDPATGARELLTGGEMGQFIVSVPGSYDANRAYPLGFAFHGYGRTHANCQENDCAGFQSVMGDEAVLVYLKSFTMGWTQDDVIDENAQFFADALAVMKSEYCIDENAVFVAGTSSGATFSNVLACRYGDELLATAPVAGGLPERTGCEGNVAALVIHGIDDTAVPFSAGEEARDFYIEQNGCSATTLPDLATAHGEVRAARDQSQGIHRCVDYQGCDAMHPVRWCEHSEGGYDNSTHGWPLVGGQLIWDFVSSLIAAP